MPQPVPVVCRKVQITNGWGMHMRPAQKFFAIAMKYDAEIKVRCKEKELDGKSILQLMTMGAGPGTDLEIIASGPQATEALAALVSLVEARFYEDDEGNEIPSEFFL